MSGKEKKELKRKFMPEYFAKYNAGMWAADIALSIVTACALTAVFICLPVSDAGSIATIVVLFLLLAGVLAGTCVALVKKEKLLIFTRTAEIKKEFCDMPLNEAQEKLLQRKIITESGFVVNNNGRQFILPFNRATVTVYSANIYTRIFTVFSIKNAEGVVVAEYIADGELYNFIMKKGVKVQFTGCTGLLVADKEKFVNYHFNAELNCLALLGALGAAVIAIINSAVSNNFSTQTVMRVVGEKYL